jgi:hypothetical protein
MSHPSFSRRQWLLASAASPFAFSLPEALAAQPKAKQPAALAPLNRFPRMVQEWYVEQVRAAEKRGEAARAWLKTLSEEEE